MSVEEARKETNAGLKSHSKSSEQSHAAKSAKNSVSVHDLLFFNYISFLTISP